MNQFIGLTTIDNTRRYVAIDQIATFVVRDKYHPNYQSQMTLKTGESFTVEESAEKIAELIEKGSGA